MYHKNGHTVKIVDTGIAAAPNLGIDVSIASIHKGDFI